MLLTTNYNTPNFSIRVESPTVVEPGNEIKINLVIIAIRPCTLNYLAFSLPEAVLSENDMEEISISLTNEETFLKQIIFKTDVGLEGFGEIVIDINYCNEERLSEKCTITNWMSVFKRELADASGLRDPLRKKLVDVVNGRNRNGHIFLADFVRFFDDFLNIEIPERIATILARTFAMEDENLPLEYGQYIDMINGDISFYGIEKMELIYEEICNESDDKFDMSDAAEIVNPNF